MELFQPNNLSRTRPEFIPVYDAGLHKQIEELLCDEYGVSDLSGLSIARFDGANISSQNLKVTTNSKSWFLKSRDIARREQMSREVELNNQLLNLGQQVPKVINSAARTSISTRHDKCWVLYEFEDGEYFTGGSAELKAAARTFGQLTLAAQKLPIFSESVPEVDEFGFLDDLTQLLEPNLLKRATDSSLVDLCLNHRKVIRDTVEQVRKLDPLLPHGCLPLHLDYHPLNLLIKHGEVVCILDLEHLKPYPVIAGVGFAAYKLIRQAMVNTEFRAQELKAPTAVESWIVEWRKSFPHSSFTVADLGIGACLRILKLVHLIVDSSLRHNDHRSNYDLPKQIHSLYEAQIVFRL